jgi:hypothetical protein
LIIQVGLEVAPQQKIDQGALQILIMSKRSGGVSGEEESDQDALKVSMCPGGLR